MKPAGLTDTQTLDGVRKNCEILWGDEEYRRVKNKALLHAALFIDITATAGSTKTVTDWGCGNGKASELFEHVGLEVVGLNDIASNALHDDSDFHDLFECAPLHKASPPGSDISFCSDVLEHVPKDLIIMSIENIVQHTTVGAFFAVSTAGSQYLGHEEHITFMDERELDSLFRPYNVFFKYRFWKTFGYYLLV